MSDKYNDKYRLSAEELFHTCDLGRFEFSSTADLEPLSTTIGQERALEAINFGVEMPHSSFNLYVMGSSGLGRHTLVRDALKEHAENAHHQEGSNADEDKDEYACRDPQKELLVLK